MATHQKTGLLIIPLLIAAFVVDDAALALVLSAAAFAIACLGLALYLMARRDR